MNSTLLHDWSECTHGEDMVAIESMRGDMSEHIKNADNNDLQEFFQYLKQWYDTTRHEMERRGMKPSHG